MQLPDQGEAGSREADAPRHVRPARRGGRLPARPVLLGRAARHRPPGRARAAPAHHRRHLAERAWRARALHEAARHRVQAHALRARRRRGGRCRAPEGRLRAPVGDRSAVRVHCRRDRNHRLPLHAPLHRRGGPGSSRHACLLEPRPRVDRVPRRARRDRAREREHPARAGHDRRAGLGRREEADRRRRAAGPPRRRARRLRPSRRRPSGHGRGHGETCSGRVFPKSRSARRASPAT